jgi:TolA-binding protein
MLVNMRFPLYRLPFFCALALLLAAGSGHAQEPLTLPAPLVAKGGDVPPANGLALQISAQRALEMGFPSIAADIYQRLLDNPATKPELRTQLTVDLVTALLVEDRTDEAAAALKKHLGLATPALRLRQALLAFREQRYEEARTLAATVTLEELPASDRSWFYYLQGQLAEAPARDMNRALALYQQAIDGAVSETQRTHFTLAREEAKLRLDNFSEQSALGYKQSVYKYQGQGGQQLYSYVKMYALTQNCLGKKSEAATFLQQRLQALPAEERAINDEWRLLLGLISGADDGVGRSALGTLLATGSDRDKQRVALQMLARASKAGNSRDDFRRRLDDLINAPSPHPLLEYLLLFRAQVALSEKDYARAEAEASRLLAQYPGSQLKGLALGVLTGVAWEQGRYRNAANQATKAREVLPADEARKQLGVLVAEAWFRAGLGSRSAPDYRNAADAYAATLDEVPVGVAPGLLMFQRLMAEVEVANADEGRGDHFARVQSLLDQMAHDNRFDPENRWKAEWNLARALEAAGETDKAYERLNHLMAAPGDSTSLPADLKAQLGWLQANLSLTVEPARTLILTEQLLGSLGGIEASLNAQIASMTMLLQAQANFALNPPNTKAALEGLSKLRANYPKSDAAVYSYIAEADYNAAHGQLVQAQGLLQNLADEYKTSSYAPYALYQAAQYAERRGGKKYLDEAYGILERLVTTYKNNDLVFYARLKQGNLLRMTNDNPGAQPIFEQLVNEFPQHQDVLSARLALADCHAAQATSDASHQESAATIYEGLLDLQGAPTDIRAEAGYKYGLSLSRRGNPNRALEVWGRLITLLPVSSKAEGLGAKGRVWISKTLFEMGDLYEKQAKLEQARNAYDLIVSNGLPYAAQAQERLARFRTPKTP